jgi:hypothetical protein
MHFRYVLESGERDAQYILYRERERVREGGRKKKLIFRPTRYRKSDYLGLEKMERKKNTQR